MNCFDDLDCEKYQLLRQLSIGIAMSGFRPVECGQTLFNRHVTVLRMQRFGDRNNLNQSAFSQFESFHCFGRQNHAIFAVDELDAHHHSTILRLQIHEVDWGIDKSNPTVTFIR